MRKLTAAVLLMLSVLLWGAWFGGQYFNEARVIPKWLSNPPQSVIAYNAIPSDRVLPFFFPLNPLIFLVSLTGAAAAWNTAQKSRKWLALTGAIGFGICLVLILYLVPLIGSISRDAGVFPADEIVVRAETWRIGNRIRLVVEFFGFVCSVLALQIWSAESAKAGEVENAVYAAF